VVEATERASPAGDSPLAVALLLRFTEKTEVMLAPLATIGASFSAALIAASGIDAGFNTFVTAMATAYGLMLSSVILPRLVTSIGTRGAAHG